MKRNVYNVRIFFHFVKEIIKYVVIKNINVKYVIQFKIEDNKYLILYIMNDKRSYSDFLDKNEFNYTINNGKIEFIKLLSRINKSNKIRFWYIYAILKNNNLNLNITEELLDIDNFNNFKLLYSDLKLYIYTDYGVINGKITKTEPTIIDKGKNINKKNETTILTQGLIYMRNLYLKKIKTGYKISLKEENIIENDHIYPMALQVYSKNKKHIIYPCYIQPKLDGIRLIAKYDKNNNDIILLSRRLNNYTGFDFIKNEIKLLLQDTPDLILDGELYNHNLNLQNISGIVRSEKEDKNKDKLKFYIFDCFEKNNNKIFEERLKLLQIKFNLYNNLQYLTLVDSILVNNEQQGNELYKNYIDNKYEGIVYKNINAIYEYSNIKEIRSYNYLKRKKTYDAEYEIIGYEEGIHGKDKGAIIFIMKTKENKEFRAVPNMPLKKRKELYKIANNNFNKFKGKLATISFDEFSEDNIPLRPKFITIRDYE